MYGPARLFCIGFGGVTITYMATKEKVHNSQETRDRITQSRFIEAIKREYTVTNE